MSQPEKIAIMGSTGSIGLSTLAVIDQNIEQYTVFALCANKDVNTLFSQVLKYKPPYIAMADEAAAKEISKKVSEAGLKTEVLSGSQSLVDLAAHEDIDTLVAAIVGAAGLASTMSAVRSGKKILLANKETLVCSGQLFMDAVAESGATLLPVDSEHNAIFQCLAGNESSDGKDISKIYLTGSGGPFRGRSYTGLKDVTPEDACSHPNWSMGRKISVDSATMMNKGLELIEACWLFDLPFEMIELVIHPQSIIHSMVEFVDGSVLAQLGSPDMKTPIAHSLAWPKRIGSGSKPFNIFDSGLSFERPDIPNYPCLALALEAAESKGAAPLVLNAANEIAVDSFLNHEIGYTDIPIVIGKIMSDANFSEPQSVDEVIEQDQIVRSQTAKHIEKMVV